MSISAFYYGISSLEICCILKSKNYYSLFELSDENDLNEVRVWSIGGHAFCLPSSYLLSCVGFPWLFYLYPAMYV